jgi:hypothetical protein
MTCQEGHLEVVKYLCEQGGKELLMLTDKVSAFKLVEDKHATIRPAHDRYSAVGSCMC